MRVIIVTGTAPHHRHLCARLLQKFNVVGIIHPLERRVRFTDRVRQMRKLAASRGLPSVGNYLAGKFIPGDYSLPSPNILPAPEEAALLRAARNRTFAMCDVHDGTACDLVRSLKPDITLCLGGPIYPEAFIDASPITLNFHAGVSPLYNGTASIQFAFANGHLRCCGGTIMRMNAAVDGGRILGHYLPEIIASDTPAKLFSKTVQGSAVMYERLLSALISGAELPAGIPQQPPLFYTRATDYGWQQKAAIARNIKHNIAARHVRAESLVEYWRVSDGAARLLLFEETLWAILWGTPISG